MRNLTVKMDIIYGLGFIKKYSIRNVNLPFILLQRKHSDSLSTNTKKILDNRSKIIKKILNKERKKNSEY